jgi:hypothetical protein
MASNILLSRLYFLPIVLCAANAAIGAGLPSDRNTSPQAPQYGQVVSWPITVSQGELQKMQKLWRSCRQVKDPCSTSAATILQESEQLYWRLLQAGDGERLDQWIDGVNDFIDRSPNISAQALGRVKMLSAFAKIMVFTALFDFHPMKFWHLDQAKKFAAHARSLLPGNVNAVTIDANLRGMSLFMLGQKQAARELLQHLLDLPKALGEKGMEAPVSAGHILIATKDPILVREGVALVKACNDDRCNLRFSLAPYRAVGNYLVLAEAAAYLGEDVAAMDAMDEGYDWAKSHGASPEYLERIQEMSADLFSPGGIVDEWQLGLGIGAIRYPFGFSQRSEVCGVCHYNAQVPANLYE